MGMGSSGKIKTPAVEQTPVPAVAQSAQSVADQSSAAQAEARARRRGISATYSRFSGDQGGLGNKLG